MDMLMNKLDTVLNLSIYGIGLSGFCITCFAFYHIIMSQQPAFDSFINDDNYLLNLL
jgi:hypothetical protein